MKVFEGVQEGTPQMCSCSQGKAISQKQFLASEQQVEGKGRKKEAQLSYFLRVDALEVEGGSLKLSIQKRNQREAASPAKDVH